MINVDVTDLVWDQLLREQSDEEPQLCPKWSAGEQAALDLYGPVAVAPRECHVVAQIGQSLDERIATVSGDAQDVSGVGGLAHLHRLRALVDAVVIGVSTALHDDPQLTVRMAKGENPARIVIDPDGRLPNDIGLFHSDCARTIIVQATDIARPKGVEVITLNKCPHIAPQDILIALRARAVADFG